MMHNTNAQNNTHKREQIYPRTSIHTRTHTRTYTHKYILSTFKHSCKHSHAHLAGLAAEILFKRAIVMEKIRPKDLVKIKNLLKYKN